MSLAVLGAGAWGTALAVRLATLGAVRLWTRSPAQARDMAAARCNARYLPGQAWPANLSVGADLAAALDGAELLVLAVPSNGLRSLLTSLRAARCRHPLVWLCKGFESGSRKLPHQVLAEAWPDHPPAAVLSGPSFAREVAQGLPAALTVASADLAFARRVAQRLHDPMLRLYASDDVVGVELGGAVKNVIAIACGVAHGRQLGDGARAALITRGFAELTRLGLAMGAKGETLSGLCGLGDLVLTCASLSSRNTSLGAALGEGRALKDVLGERRSVAEGAESAPAVVALADRHGVEMPICAAVDAIVAERISIDDAIQQLLSRPFRAEGA